MKFIGENSLTKLLNLIKNIFDTKVDKIDGKTLSANDYTDEDKEKVAKIPTESEEAELVSFIEYTEAEIQSLWDSVSV